MQELRTSAVEDYTKAIYALERRESEPVTTNALAERLGVTAGSASAMVKRLGELGLAEHRPYHGVSLTDQGRRTCEDYYAVAGPAWREAFDFVSEADEPVVRKFFTDMIEQFSELTRKERTR